MVIFYIFNGTGPAEDPEYPDRDAYQMCLGAPCETAKISFSCFFGSRTMTLSPGRGGYFISACGISISKSSLQISYLLATSSGICNPSLRGSLHESPIL